MLIGQQTLEGILRSYLERCGCSVELGTELQSFEDDGERVLAKLVKRKDGEEISETFEASYLIGADGAKGVYRL
jgi:2-polyprenyl-6-methoxyphenol hydroxylase-like FAD-dependent oxidoreductase